MDVALFQALFAPRGIALFGASGDAAKNTARPHRYLRKHGYAGTIAPINRTRREVLGETAYPSLAAAPGEIDHAFIMVEDVEAVTREDVAAATKWLNRKRAVTGYLLKDEQAA